MLAAEVMRGRVPVPPVRALPPPVRGVVAAAAAAACAVLLYLPALEYGFVFDDLSLLAADGQPAALGGALPYRPLRYASYLVDWSLGGSAAVFHAHNVMLHAMVASLAALLASRLGAGAFAAFAGALVVALHPLAVESAAYVAGRRDLLCVAFGLASLVAWLGNRNRGRPLLALALLVCSVAAKESGLVFAVPLAAAAVLYPAASGTLRALAATGAATAAAAAMAFAYGAMGPWLPGSDALASGGRVLLHYAAGLAGLRMLAPEYPVLFAPAEAGVASLAAALVALAATAAAAWSCVRARRSDASREHAFVLAWTVAAALSLALWAGVHEPGADRHAYLLLPPLGVGASLLLTRVPEWLRRPGASPGAGSMPVPRIALAACGVLLAAVAAGSSREQMQIWSSEHALWTRAVAQDGASSRAYANLARVAAAGGDYALARRHLAAALAAGGDDGLVYAGRAALRCAEGKRALAQRDVRRAHRAGAAPLVRDIARDCDLSLHARMHLRRRGDRHLEAFGK